MSLRLRMWLETDLGEGLSEVHLIEVEEDLGADLAGQLRKDEFIRRVTRAAVQAHREGVNK